jgi:hypothetical protein
VVAWVVDTRFPPRADGGADVAAAVPPPPPPRGILSKNRSRVERGLVSKPLGHRPSATTTTITSSLSSSSSSSSPSTLSRPQSVSHWFQSSIRVLPQRVVVDLIIVVVVQEVDAGAAASTPPCLSSNRPHVLRSSSTRSSGCRPFVAILPFTAAVILL